MQDKKITIPLIVYCTSGNEKNPFNYDIFCISSLLSRFGQPAVERVTYTIAESKPKSSFDRQYFWGWAGSA